MLTHCVVVGSKLRLSIVHCVAITMQCPSYKKLGPAKVLKKRVWLELEFEVSRSGAGLKPCPDVETQITAESVVLVEYL